MTREELYLLAEGAEEALSAQFREIDRIAFAGTKKVMDAFAEFHVSESLFASSSGYGYDDRGRDTLDQIYARVFDAESAIVRSHIVNGNKSLTLSYFGNRFDYHKFASYKLFVLSCGNNASNDLSYKHNLSAFLIFCLFSER